MTNREEIKELIKDIKERLKTIEYYLEYGATLGEIENLLNDYEVETKALKDSLIKLMNEETLKDLKNIESDIY